VFERSLPVLSTALPLLGQLVTSLQSASGPCPGSSRRIRELGVVVEMAVTVEMVMVVGVVEEEQQEEEEEEKEEEEEEV
jgi:hypothetical protein